MSYREATQKEVEMLEQLMKPKGVDGFWWDVDIFMKYLYESYPQDMRALEIEAELERNTAYNKFSSNRFKTQRMYGKMPDLLINMLDRIYSRQYPMSQKQFKKGFFKRYPKLRVAEVI